VVLAFAAAYFAAVYLEDNLRPKMLVERIYAVSNRFFSAPIFFNHAIAHGLWNLLTPDKTETNAVARAKKPGFQLCFSFWKGGVKTGGTPNFLSPGGDVKTFRKYRSWHHSNSFLLTWPSLLLESLEETYIKGRVLCLRKN